MERHPGMILLDSVDPGLSHGLLGNLLTNAGKLGNCQLTVVIRQIVIHTGIPQTLLDAVGMLLVNQEVGDQRLWRGRSGLRQRP